MKNHRGYWADSQGLHAPASVRYRTPISSQPAEDPYRDGTAHAIFDSLDFIAPQVGWVPKPRVNLTRFHGVFAPNSKQRARVTPAKRGRGHHTPIHRGGPAPTERHAAITWVQRLKRAFHIDIETCRSCGGVVKVIPCIEDPVVIRKIFDHLQDGAQGGLDPPCLWCLWSSPQLPPKTQKT